MAAPNPNNTGKNHPHAHHARPPVPHVLDKSAQCEMFRLMGDEAQLKKANCDSVPRLKHILKTMPTGNQRGIETDETIAYAFKFILLGVLLLIALCLIIVCCCRWYKRIGDRRALLRSRMKAAAARTGYASCRPCGPCSPPRPPCGYLPNRPIGNLSFTEDCNICPTDVNLI